ncbi:MAG: hypothetical protein Faunusvirus20_18 [Faunusvirus sp.]|uniref:Uncharacterized protein n=1 Tax=Faunusvirus sp. TaxID=2487766 RepID=A0A3G4ZXB3_9VIRU|nr:MAG: hypothetical protein Faunusvirus20_18 [Faunusvirus sp.]
MLYVFIISVIIISTIYFVCNLRTKKINPLYLSIKQSFQSNASAAQQINASAFTANVMLVIYRVKSAYLWMEHADVVSPQHQRVKSAYLWMEHADVVSPQLAHAIKSASRDLIDCTCQPDKSALLVSSAGNLWCKYLLRLRTDDAILRQQLIGAAFGYIVPGTINTAQSIILFLFTDENGVDTLIFNESVSRDVPHVAITARLYAMRDVLYPLHVWTETVAPGNQLYAAFRKYAHY